MPVVRFVSTRDRPPIPAVAAGAAAVALRPADLDAGGDRDAIAALVRAAAWPRESGDGDSFLAELTGRTGRSITVWLAVAACPSSAVGLVALCRTRGGWSIPWLLVHPAARRRGVARRLVAHAVAHAHARGAATVTAESLASWPDAVAFWQAAGFTPRQGAGDVL